MQTSLFESKPMPGSTMEFPSQDITQLKHRGNEFSAEANKSIKGVKSQLRNKVLQYIESCGGVGSTSEECEIALDLAHTTVSARFSELKALDKITLVGKRQTKSGRAAGVYAIR